MLWTLYGKDKGLHYNYVYEIQSQFNPSAQHTHHNTPINIIEY